MDWLGFVLHHQSYLNCSIYHYVLATVEILPSLSYSYVENDLFDMLTGWLSEYRVL